MKHLLPVGLCTTTQKRRGTEETRKTSKHYLPRPTVVCSTQSDFSDMGTGNWKSENIDVIKALFFLFCVFLLFSVLESDSNRYFSVKVVRSCCLSDLFHVCVLGEAADITAAPSEAEDEGHQKPRPLQSTK